MKRELIVNLCILFVISFLNISYADNNGSSLLTNCKAYVYLNDNKHEFERNIADHDSLASGYKFTTNAHQCLSLIRGMDELNNIYRAMNNNVYFCIPDEVTTGQLARIMVKFLEDNPARLHESDTILITHAFIQLYPCR